MDVAEISYGAKKEVSNFLFDTVYPGLLDTADRYGYDRNDFARCVLNEAAGFTLIANFKKYAGKAAMQR